MQGISVRLIDMIAHQDKLTLIHGDIGNAFLQATTKEKCHTIYDDYRGEHSGNVAVIKKAFYRLTTCAAQ